jgi:hypothetical protein
MLNITKQMFKAFSGVALIVTTILGMTLGVSAQSQNPSVWQQIKNAAKQAKQQKTQQQSGQQAPPKLDQPTNTASGQPPNSSSGPPAQSGSAATGADCCTPETMKKIAASLGFVDIVGIKLGMTPAQALAAIKAYKSTFKIEILNTRLFHPGVETFTRVPRYISAQEPNSGKGYEYINVEFTQPPSPPLVSKIQRYIAMPAGQPIMASTLLESLRKKYGQYNFSQNGPLAWIYDLSGKLPVRLPNTAAYCAYPEELPRGDGEPQSDYGQISLDTTSPNHLGGGNTIDLPGCVPYVVFVARGVAEETPPTAQLAQLTTTLESGALVYNSGRATYNWLKAEADAKAKQEEDAARARTGPKL